MEVAIAECAKARAKKREGKEKGRAKVSEDTVMKGGSDDSDPWQIQYRMWNERDIGGTRVVGGMQRRGKPPSPLWLFGQEVDTPESPEDKGTLVTN